MLRNGSNTKGYFAWTFLDCLELLDGYESSYGFYYVDLDDKDLTRYPKLSAHWLIDPLVFGDYPETVKQRARGRIPVFTKYESEQIKGSLDFIGVNHYNTILVKDDPSIHDIDKWDFSSDVSIEAISKRTRRNGTLIDTPRVEYLHGYIGSMLDAIRNGSNTKGYFAWTFLDCLELLDGYKSSYGFYYVDLDDKDLTRYPKLSAHWYSNFLQGKSTT
ncbi:Beta-glucosidase [Handroanthus impetiginosus]|uniref:Beta-glucosidase n=1 Tax=Handroanthus impetiginosus TaxID=429701 RepID=A0A2G9HKF6_9LAMI|nr:Beta-glucosidase [Handroanthus impetiginosus]